MGSSRLAAFSSSGAGIAAPICRESELGPQQIGASTLEFVERCGLRHGEQLHRRLERARLDLRLSRGQRACAPAAPGPGSAPPRARGTRPRRLGPARLRPAGRALQLGGHRLVRPRRGVGQMPRPPVSIGVRIGRLGQGPVRCPPVTGGGRLVDRGADQGMAEVHPGAELDQSSSLGRRCGVGWDPLQLGRAPQQGHVAGRLGRGGQQQPPVSGAEATGTAGESCLRCGWPAAAGREARNRPPARPDPVRGAVAAGRAGCRLSRRRYGPAPPRPPVRRSPWASNVRASVIAEPGDGQPGHPASS